jgi:UDP-glucose 4-epimerase
MDICNEDIKSIFEDERPDIVNHHAAQMDVRKSVSDPIYDANVNILGTINLLQNCIQFKTQKFIFASTGGAVYGEQDYFPADEKHPTRPISPYGITKLTSEKYIHFYHLAYGLKFSILRYANIYGPRQNPHGEAGVVAIFSKKMLIQEQPYINGDGKQTRDYVYIEDVVRANEMMLTKGDNKTYNIGTGVETDVNQMFRKIRKHIKYPVKELYASKQTGEQKRSVLDAGFIKMDLGWEPTVDLHTGLDQTIEFFRQRLI